MTNDHNPAAAGRAAADRPGPTPAGSSPPAASAFIRTASSSLFCFQPNRCDILGTKFNLLRTWSQMRLFERRFDISHVAGFAATARTGSNPHFHLILLRLTLGAIDVEIDRLSGLKRNPLF